MSVQDGKRTFVLSDPGENSNKVWTVSVSGRTLTVEWGRVGNSLQKTTTVDFDEKKDYEKKIAEKINKGYKEVKLLECSDSHQSTVATNVKDVAVRDIVKNDDPVVRDLVEKLAEANRHDIALMSGGRITVEASTLSVKTEVGAVTPDQVIAAKQLLNDLAKVQDFDTKEGMVLLGEYLMLIPQRVGNSRGWHKTFFSEADSFQRQGQFLDALETAAQAAIDAARGEKKTVDKAFECSLTISDEATHHKVVNFFERGRNVMHTSNSLRPRKTYTIDHPSMRSAFRSELTPVEMLWHGTRTHNVLSILKQGLVIPKSGGSIKITGRMFGDGVYFSDQSTKSLNYAHGYWDSSARDDQCYMFLCDVAMGKSYTPDRPTQRLPPGHDSMRAIGGKSGVMNNESIVYNVNQCVLTHLVEFGR